MVVTIDLREEYEAAAAAAMKAIAGRSDEEVLAAVLARKGGPVPFLQAAIDVAQRRSDLFLDPLRTGGGGGDGGGSPGQGGGGGEAEEGEGGAEEGGGVAVVGGAEEGGGDAEGGAEDADERGGEGQGGEGSGSGARKRWVISHRDLLIVHRVRMRNVCVLR